MTKTKDQIAIYQTADGKTQIDVRIEQDNVWLTQRQMSEVFDTTPENILMHLKNIFSRRGVSRKRNCYGFLGSSNRRQKAG